MGRDNSPKERQRRQLERKLGRRASYDRILIVSEGSKTEPNYFKEIRAEYRLHSANVEVQPGALGTQPIQVVEYARELFEKGDSHKGIRPRVFEQVYAVFDRDDHPTFHDALARARALDGTLRNDLKQPVKFVAIPSRPSFEFWLLLHFEDELRAALALYCQMPFGRMHSRNPEIIALAEAMGRTPSSVAMKLVNFASLDPHIAASGRKGLGNASALDRVVWQEFQQVWDAVLVGVKLPTATPDAKEVVLFDDTPTVGARTGEVRLKQSLFRRMVLSSYAERCCISGLSEQRLLVASHIVPWGVDARNRLNPSNGLCLSVLHDKAFDRGLITVTPDAVVRVSGELRRLEKEPFASATLLSLDGGKIRTPEKFFPDPNFLRWHIEHIFLR